MISYRPSSFLYTSSTMNMSSGGIRRSFGVVAETVYKLKDRDRIIIYPVACSSKGHPPSKKKMKHFGKSGVIEGYRSYGSGGILKLKVRLDDGSLAYPDLSDVLPLKKV